MKPEISEIGQWVLSNRREELFEHYRKHGTYAGFSFQRDGKWHVIVADAQHDRSVELDAFMERIKREIGDI